MEDFKQLIIEKGSVVLENDDKTIVYEINYDNEKKEFKLKHLGKQVKKAKKFETIHKYLVESERKKSSESSESSE